MRGRQSRTERLVSQQRPLNRRIIEWNPTVTYVDASLLQRRDLLEGGELEQRELDTRAGRAVAPDEFRQPAVERRRDEADTEARPLDFMQAAA